MQEFALLTQVQGHATRQWRVLTGQLSKHITLTHHLVFVSYVHSSSVALSMVAAIERIVVTVQFCICPVCHAVYYK